MSRNEGFPTVTIESMFCGLPAITSDIPQFREQINTGVNGYMVPVNNADELSRTISFAHKMPKDEYETLVNNALNSFNELSLQNVCKKLVRIYKKLKQD
jgi:glycosyltransferase involved in cell wall biosynthesis